MKAVVVQKVTLEHAPQKVKSQKLTLLQVTLLQKVERSIPGHYGKDASRKIARELPWSKNLSGVIRPNPSLTLQLSKNRNV